MPTYALLLRASANRVYGAAAFGLASAELAVVDRTQLGAVTTDLRRATLGGVDYLRFDTADPLGDAQLRVLSNLSSLHATYAVEGDLLRPCAVTPLAAVDEDIVTIQRYPGKTNEAFTHLLVNVALASSGTAMSRLLDGERIHLVDPACGRGTSLNRAVVYGMDATGIEVDQRDVEAYAQFLLTWLKDKRLKHHLEQARLRRGRETPAHRVTVSYGRDRDRSTHHAVDIIHDDTLNARSHLKARCADVLVCDLPYGVQHGSQPGGQRLERGPASLLRDALPVWFDLMRPGAAMALGWNRKTLGRDALVELVVRSGFRVAHGSDPDAFAHRVDRAITRDVLIAARPAH
ncbi:MAG: SAM-dependent methyltransferase [Microthrixaceae bacterium]